MFISKYYFYFCGVIKNDMNMNAQRIVGNAKTKYDMASEMDFMLRKMNFPESAHWTIYYTSFKKEEIKEKYIFILEQYNNLLTNKII